MIRFKTLSVFWGATHSPELIETGTREFAKRRAPKLLTSLILLTVALILSWHFSTISLHSDAVLVKAAEKIKGRDFALPDVQTL